MKLADVSIHRWIQENEIKNERGEPLDFRNHLFLYDIYRDFSPKLVAYKAAQIGFSTLAIIRNFYVCSQRKMDAIYTLPTQGDVYDFVGGKVNRIIAANPYLQSLVKDRDTMEQKRVGSNVVYYRGTFTEKQALMVTSDWNIHDEEDRSNQAVIQQYHSRLQHSQYAWEHHFSNPSVEGNGVSRYWADSDQKHWFIKCEKCTREQFLMWPDSVDMERACYQCKFCHAELSDENRRVGRWVKKKSDKQPEYSGYWISLLMAPWIPASEVIKLFNTKSKEYFWNFVLGLPYVGEGNKVTPDVLFRNLTKTLNRQKNVVIGVDSGIVKHFVCGNRQGLFYTGKTEKWKDIEHLLDRFDRSIAVIDAMPDITGPRELQEKYPGRVFLCHYARDRKTQQIVRWGQNEEAGNVLVDRNRAIQMVIDEFSKRRIPLEGNRDDWGEYAEHWDTLYRMATEDKVTHSPTFDWMSSTGVDHFCHACFVGDTLISTEKGLIPIRDVKVGDRVLTREGFEEVTFSGLIKESNTSKVEFDDGRTIEATPDHKFWTENDMWKELQYCTTNDILVSIWNNDLTEKYISFTKGKGIFLEQAEKGCIEKFGYFIEAQFQKVFTFTIKMAILLITKYRIWNWLMHSNIYLRTLYEKLLKNLFVKYAELSISRKTMDLIAIAPLNADQRFMRNGTIKWKGNVESVKNDLPPISISGQPSVLKTVRIRTIVNGTKRIPVYGITVGNSHEYFANNILVSNSVYWRIGMDKYGFGDAEIIGQDSPILAPAGPDIHPDRTIQPLTREGKDPIQQTLENLKDDGGNADWDF